MANNALDLAKQIMIQNPQAAVTGGEGGIIAKPQRYTTRPKWQDYISKENKATLDDIEYFDIVSDYDKELQRHQDYLKKVPNSEYSQKAISLLSDPQVKSYIQNRNAYNKQLDADFKEYSPEARKAILNKILGDGDLYRTERWNGDIENWEEIDDLYDSSRDEFNKRYGYTDFYNGQAFAPLNQMSHTSVLGDELRDENGKRTGRWKYNKSAYIGEMLRSGNLTIEELKQLLGGK